MDDAKRLGRYDETVVYVFEGLGNPLGLLDSCFFASRDKFSETWPVSRGIVLENILAVGSTILPPPSTHVGPHAVGVALSPLMFFGVDHA